MAGTGTTGRLSDLMRRLLMRRATVSACADIADRFRLITLEGAALKGVDWSPGQKVQIAMAAPFVTRTYTPIEWDAAAGRTRLLCFMEAGGPGTTWARHAAPGDEIDLFGPRASLDARSLPGPLAIFGDETSIGLAYAHARGGLTRPCTYHFEVGDPEPIGRLLETLGIPGALLFPRQEHDGEPLDARLDELGALNASFVLSGKAATVQRLRQALKRRGVPANRVIAKAYWAPGKTGLD